MTEEIKQPPHWHMIAWNNGREYELRQVEHSHHLGGKPHAHSLHPAIAYDPENPANYSAANPVNEKQMSRRRGPSMQFREMAKDG